MNFLISKTMCDLFNRKCFFNLTEFCDQKKYSFRKEQEQLEECMQDGLKQKRMKCKTRTRTWKWNAPAIKTRNTWLKLSFWITTICYQDANLCKSCRKYDELLLEFCEWSGAKAYQSDRSRQELSNEYLVAKIGFDTAENEPLKVWITDHTFDHIPSRL